MIWMLYVIDVLSVTGVILYTRSVHVIHVMYNTRYI